MAKIRILSVISPLALSTAFAATSISFLSLPSDAQMVLEEVLVTARKKEETLQETPLAVTALSGDELRNQGLRNLLDLSRSVPNIDVATDTNAQIYIRGVGVRNFNINFDSGVGIYLDGAYLSRPQGGLLDNVDLATVQVVRGPQGTLFGKNTTGGAVIYTTNRPTDEWEGDVEMRVGNHGREDYKATINVPLIPGTLNSRFSLWSVHRDGYVKNVWDDSDRNEESRTGGRGQLRWLPSDNLTVDLNYSFSETDQAGFGADCNPVDVPGAGFQAILQSPILLNATGKTLAQHCAENGALGIDTVINDYLVANTEEETDLSILTMDWDISESVSMKSITSTYDIESTQETMVDGVGIPYATSNAANSVNAISEPFKTDIFSQEFQLTGTAFNDRLSYTTGLFYFEEESSVGVYGGQGPLAADRFPGSPAPLPGGMNFLFYLAGQTVTETNNESTAFFAQADWELAEQWTLSAGVRYTDETREFTLATYSPDVSISFPPAMPLDDVIGGSPSSWLLPGGAQSFNLAEAGWVVANNPERNQTLSTEDDEWTPMIGLSYAFDNLGWIDSGDAYLTYSEGFLSGGIDVNPDQVTGKLGTFGPEDVKNYELGIKLTGFDNTLTLNTALFHMDYTDRQLTSVKLDVGASAPSATTVNAGASTIQGLEVEAAWLPTPNLQFTASFALNDGNIEEFDDTRILFGGAGPALGLDCVSLAPAPLDVCSVDRSDEDLPRLPKHTYTLGARMVFEVAGGELVPQISYNYRDSVEYCQDRASCLSGVYNQDREDLSASLSWSNDAWRVRFWGNNLTDKRYIAGGQFIVDPFGTAMGTYNVPRTYGMDFGYNF